MSEEFVPSARPRFAQWLARPMLANGSTYMKVAAAAALINVFALVTSLFSMTVYDRVLPNNAVASLIGLSIGLAFVVVFDFVLRSLRAYFVDIAGADVDRQVGDTAFDRLMRLRLDSKRGSTGALAGVMRELDTLRDVLASATMVAMIDVPFIIVTLAVIALIGGWLVLVPLLLVPVAILAGVLTYPAMDRLAREGMRDGLSKQGVLVEAIGGIETVKATGAAPLLGRRWIDALDSQSRNGLRQRVIGTLSMNVANAAQTLSYAGTIVVGAHMIEARTLTVGGLIACSLLGSRAVAPLSSIAQLLSRLASARTAYRQVSAFMDQPVEGEHANPLRPAQFEGHIEFRNVSFRYPGAAADALTGVNLTIKPGERIALLGRIGSGKSTLARLALGLYQPTDGLVLIDGLDVRQLDLTLLRANVGTALQESVLLSGTVRDNILLGRDHIGEEDLLRVAKLTGVHDFVSRVTNGYDLVLADRGESLSGGQRQSISLARALVHRPPMMLFDEPTSAMDQDSEARLINQLLSEVEGRTLIVISHRMSLLRLVERVIVVTDGRIVADGPRDEMLRRMTVPKKAA